jgi:hypothetical protein
VPQVLGLIVDGNHLKPELTGLGPIDLLMRRESGPREAWYPGYTGLGISIITEILFNLS